MEPDFTEIGKLLQSGGNAALIIAVYFIYKAAHRLSRIELMLEILLTRIGKDFDANDLKKLIRERNA